MTKIGLKSNYTNNNKRFLHFKDNCIYIMGSQESQKAELRFKINDCTV
jgi:hypothetical protein